MLNLKERDIFSIEESHLCLISKDVRIKNILINIINKTKRVDYWKIYPLIENWGMIKKLLI